ILFAGCKQNTKAADTTEAELSQEESTATEDTSPQETTTIDEIPEPDPSASIRNPATYRPQDRGENFIETDSFYYYLNNGRIYFSDKTGPTFYLLCSKPNCTHDGEDCNAYGGGEGSALGYWEGKLYAAGSLNGELALVQLDLDGSNHELVTYLEMPLDASGQRGGSYDFYFANGYLFYVVTAQPSSFFRVDLSTGKTDSLFSDVLSDGSGTRATIRFDADSLYFDLITTDGIWWLCQWPCGGGAVRKLLSWPRNDAPRWNVENGIISYYAKTDGTFYEYDIEAQTLTAKASVQLGPGAAYYDVEYIYLVTWEEIGSGYLEFYVFDRDYNLLQHISLPHYGDYLYAAGDKLFFSNTYSCMITHYLPFSEIGSEDAELHPVKDPYAPR
ncbi:MAG: hypothetical protein IJL71_03940, partial [Oscillospiraceae bacterium]|nr:hypothetical protein [Oscillospiraceae bacterium]